MSVHCATDVTAVTVYPDRARVTRSGVVALKPGLCRLEVTELPQSLTPESVRVSARGTAPMRLLGVDVRRDYYVETPAERVRELQRQVETLQDELQSLEAQTALIERERDQLGAVTGQAEIFARGLASGRTTVADQMACFDALRQRAEEQNAELLTLEGRRRELARRLAKQQQDLSQLRSAGKRQRYTAVIEVDGDRACELALDLTYVVRGAGWSPLYDVRLVEAGQSPMLEVGYLAQVSQQTGEDWADAALILSTARPALAETLPELKPWYVGPVRARPLEAQKWVSAEAAPAMLMQDAAVDGRPEAAMEAEPVVATVEQAGAAVTYRIPGAATIPADGSAHKATIARFELMPVISYVASPRLVEAAYRRAAVTNDSAYLLLPGAVNLFVGETFIGATRIDLTAPDGEIQLYLGPDDRMRVERELTRRDVDRRLIGGQRRLAYSYSVTVENLLPGEAELTLHDQIPVARHEDIKVRLVATEPDPSEQNDLGILTWELTLSPREKRTVNFDFVVEHPRDMEVMDLL